MVFLSRLFLVPDVFSPDHVKGVIHGGSHLSGLVSPVDVALLSPYTVMVAPSLEAEWVRNHLVKYVSLVPSRIGEVYVELDILQRHGVPHSPNPMRVSL